MALGSRLTGLGHILSPRYTILGEQYRRSFSVVNRPPPSYPGHVPLTSIERGALAIGSAVVSLLNPRRGGQSRMTLDILCQYHRDDAHPCIQIWWLL